MMNKINKMQRKVIIIGIAVFILMGLCPPWVYIFTGDSIERQKPAGYSCIIAPPKPEKDSVRFGVKIDVSRLFVQWLVVAAATGLGVFIKQTNEEGETDK